MGGANFQCHLIIFTKIYRLDILARAQIPKMDGVAIFVGQQILSHYAVFVLWWQAPFRADHVVLRQVPPKIIVFVLLASIHLVAANDLECLAIHDENTGWAVCPVLATATKGRDIDAFRSAVDRVWARISCLLEQLFWLNDFVDMRLQRIFDVKD